MAQKSKSRDPRICKCVDENTWTQADTQTVRRQRRLVGVESEADALQDPVADVLGGVQVRLEHETDSHGVTSLRRHVDRRAQRVLKLQPLRLDRNDLYHRHRLHARSHSYSADDILSVEILPSTLLPVR